MSHFSETANTRPRFYFVNFASMVTIYDTSGNIRFKTPINKDSKRVFKLMGDDYVTLKFSVLEPVYFVLGDYCDLPGFGRFELVTPYQPNFNNTTGGYDYELKLEAQHMKWRNKILKYLPGVGGSDCAWQLTATAAVHLDQILANVNALATIKEENGIKIYRESYLHNGIEPWQVYIDGSVDASAKNISYDQTNIIDALSAIAEKFECEWWIDGNVIRLGKCEDSGGYIDLEIGVNVTQMSRSDSRENYVTRIIPFGSDRNISPRYRKDLIFDVKFATHGGNLIRDDYRPLETDWFPANMSNPSPSEQKTFSLFLSHFDENGVTAYMAGDYLIKSMTQTTEGVGAGEWVFKLSDFNPGLQLSKREGTCQYFKVKVVITGVDEEDKAVGKTFETSTYLYAVGPEIYCKFPDDDSFVIEKPLKTMTVTLEVYACLGVGATVVSKVLSSKKPLIAYNKDAGMRVTGLEIERIDSKGKLIETFSGAVYNPYYKSKVSERNYIELPEGAVMNVGNRFRITNILRNKVKSSYFSSRYSAYDDLSNVVRNGVVTSRLMIPEEKGFYIDYNENMSMEQGVEDVVVFEDIYPRAICTVTDIRAEEKTIKEPNDDGTETDRKVFLYWVKDDFFSEKDDNGKVKHEFSLDYVIDDKLQITFQDGKRYKEGDDIPKGCQIGQLVNPESGKLNGWTFDCNFHRDPDGTAVWEIVRDTNGDIPNEVLHPEPGDQFVLTGMDIAIVNDLYVANAEEELYNKAILYLKKHNIDPSTYDCTLMSDVANEGLTLALGNRINLINEAYIQTTTDSDGRRWGRKSRVIGYEVFLDFPYDNPVYTIGEKASYSRLGAIEDQIDALKFSMGGGYYGSGGSGSSVNLIGINDRTAPSDRNAYSSLRADSRFLRKDTDDRTPGSLSVGKVLNAEGELRVGDFVAGYQGADVDKPGNAEFESVFSRSYLKVMELIYNRLNALEGDMSFADSGTIESISQSDSDTFVATMRKRWDGDFTAFQEGDIVYGFVNNLANSTNVEYSKAWGWVKSVNRADNTLVIERYPDVAVPSGHNTALTQGMLISRWGNVIIPSQATSGYPFIEYTDSGWINQRQQSFYISSADGNIVELVGVDAPILSKGNYGTVLGRIPKGLLPFETEKLLNLAHPYLYARGIVVQDLIRVGYEGVTMKQTNYRGEWSATTAASKTEYYRTIYGLADVVTWKGEMWQCVVTGTTDEPKVGCGSWLRMNGTDALANISRIVPSASSIKVTDGNADPKRLTAYVEIMTMLGSVRYDDSESLLDAGYRLYYHLDGGEEIEFRGSETPLQLEDESGYIESEEGEEILTDGGSEIFALGDDVAITTEDTDTEIELEESAEDTPVFLTIGSVSVNLGSVSDRIVFTLRKADTGEDVASEVVPIMRDGSRGATIRGPQIWSEIPDDTFMQDGSEGCQFIDVVQHGTEDGKPVFWMCVGRHEKSADKEPNGNNDKYWHKGDNFNIVATQLLLARKIIADEIDTTGLKSEVVEAYSPVDPDNPSAGRILRATVNKNGVGEYIQYNDKGGMLMQLNAGVMTCYLETGEIAWELGPDGNIKKGSSNVWNSLQLISTDENGNNIKVAGNLTATPTTYYVYISDNSGNGFTSLYKNDATFDNPIPDGWYVRPGFAMLRFNDGHDEYVRTIYRYQDGMNTEIKGITWLK